MSQRLHMTFEKNKYFHMKNLFTIILLSSFGIFFSQEKDILKVFMTQQSAWNNGDIENFMKGYWKNDSLLFYRFKRTNLRLAKTLDNYKKTYPNKEMMGILEFSDIQVKMLGKNMLMFSESGNLSVQMTLLMEFTPWFSRNLMMAGKLFQTIQTSCRMVELKRKTSVIFYNSPILKSSASFKKETLF